MQLTQDQNLRPVQSQRIAPHQIQANLLLQCNAQELLQAIALEQQENPALDSADSLEETFGCPQCSAFGLCPRCAQRVDERAEGEDGAAMDAETAGDDAAGGGDSAEERQTLRVEWESLHLDAASVSPARDTDFDPLMLVRAPTNLADQLLLHLRATAANAAEVAVSEYLVDCLDDQGFLHLDIDEACAVLRVPCRLISEGVARLQSCDPPGIGARNLRECLLIQIRARCDQDDPAEYDPLAETLLRDHWEALTQRRLAHVARMLHVTPARLEEAVHFIRQRLTPQPAAQFRAPWDHCPNTQSVAVRPDVVIRRTLSGFSVDVMGMDGLELQVNAEYRRLYESIQSSRRETNAWRRVSDHERHVVTFVERADLFLKNLQQRRRTIQRITEAIVEQQQGFLETGKRPFLRPLTRTYLAQALYLHESTVSRALLHKYVQLPSQEVVSFDIFFENAVSIKDAVAELIAEESPDAPLTDQTIVKILQSRGITVARRTVVKYRDDLRIPASYLRRRR